MTSEVRPPAGRDTAGMTLIEIMVALVILAVGVLALAGVQTRSSSDVYATGRRSRALEVAQAQVEMTRGVGFELVVPDSGQTDGFNWRTDVDSVQVGLKHVCVTVSWSEAGVPLAMQLNSMVASR